MEDLDVRLRAGLHDAAGGGRSDGVPPESLRHHVVVGVRTRRARRARAVGALAAVVLAAVVVTSIAVGSSGGPAPVTSATARVPAHLPASSGPAPDLSLPSTAAAPATAGGPTTTGPDRFGSSEPCVTVSVAGGPAACAGVQGDAPNSPSAGPTGPTTVAVGQTVVVSVPAADGRGPVTATGTALRPEGGDRFRAVAPGLSTLSLAGPVRWTLTVRVS